MVRRDIEQTEELNVRMIKAEQSVKVKAQGENQETPNHRTEGILGRMFERVFERVS